MDPLNYIEALSADFLHHLVSFLAGGFLLSLLVLGVNKRRISAAKQELNVEKNNQFTVAITTSHEEIVALKDHYRELAGDEDSTTNKAYKENYRKYTFYTQVYSYSLALMKHGWTRS